MLRIRLKRAGGRNHPFYRVVVIDSRKARDSRAVEEIGYYNPLEDPVVFNVDRERVAHWTSQGAQLTDSVKTLLKRENTTHPTRRPTAAFEPAAPEEPKKKAKKEEAEAAVAVEEAPAEEPKAEEAPAEEPQAEAAPEAEAPAEEPAAEEPQAEAEEGEKPEA